ncbi:MAG: circularly permuted type 2 ATP-grasp protein [Thermaerobacterales bacterium]
MRALFDEYRPPAGYDEMFLRQGQPRKHYQALYHLLSSLSPEAVAQQTRLSRLKFLYQGITFAVQGQTDPLDKIFPFDLIPRMIPWDEWTIIDRGLRQRLQALNLFLADIYGEQRILAEGVVPASLVLTCGQYRQEMIGFRPPGKVYIHIAGIDLIRSPDGRYRVLEDNVRIPSGVSYALANRTVMTRLFPRWFRNIAVTRVGDYADRLLRTLQNVSPDGADEPVVVLLTPGRYNAAYFEHAYLAKQMGVELVEGSDLTVEADKVYIRTTHGLQQVNVIYRRVDDEFLDPRAFRSDSLLGVPGLFEAYRKGNVTLANAIGTGVADDKAIYAYVLDIIRFYLAEEPILDNIPTYLAERPQDYQYIMDRMDELVVKETEGAGGYGMLIGPQASKQELAHFRDKIKANPRGYIAQPLVELSHHPCIVNRRLQPSRIDLRPYVLSGQDTSWVMPGGLTRVALKQGSYVVNSSQGGGSKDTWVLAARLDRGGMNNRPAIEGADGEEGDRC